MRDAYIQKCKTMLYTVLEGANMSDATIDKYALEIDEGFKSIVSHDDFYRISH